VVEQCHQPIISEPPAGIMITGGDPSIRRSCPVEIGWNTIHAILIHLKLVSVSTVCPRRALSHNGLAVFRNIYSVKVSRFITHNKRLQDCAEPLNTFITRAKNLKHALGPLLYQLPPDLHHDNERLEVFLRLLPPDLK
jgi:hypothetical protein